MDSNSMEAMKETVLRTNREALRDAQKALGTSSMDNKMMMYGVAIAVAVLAFFLFRNMKYNFVMVTRNGKKEFDSLRGMMAAVVVGLLVVLVYSLMKN